jgi:hypothetical protein
MDKPNIIKMQININISHEQIEKLFTAKGFEIVDIQGDSHEPIHGSRFELIPVVERCVKDPHSGNLIPLTKVAEKLVNSCVYGMLYGMSKFELIQSLNNN